jgi:hypothetical protein
VLIVVYLEGVECAAFLRCRDIYGGATKAGAQYVINLDSVPS